MAIDVNAPRKIPGARCNPKSGELTTPRSRGQHKSGVDGLFVIKYKLPRLILRNKFAFIYSQLIKGGKLPLYVEDMITNLYIITAISVIGGTLFGFDLSSMSAM